MSQSVSVDAGHSGLDIRIDETLMGQGHSDR